MHAFTRPSPQLRIKVREALLRSLHHSSLYRRLIVANQEKGVRTKRVGQVLHKKLTHSPREGTTFLKFLYGQLYNGKLALRYGHAPATDECPLCHKPDSYTHIAGECPDHESLRISRYNAACQLVHAVIRKSAKGGAALHSPPDLILAMADTSVQSMTTGDSIQTLSPTPEDTDHSPTTKPTPHDWLAPLPTTEEIRRKQHTEVSMDPRYNHWSLSATAGDTECTAAPNRIPDWVLPRAETQMMFDAGHGTALDLIYARGVPNTPSPDPYLLQQNAVHSHHHRDRIL
jgi:hypothetical protein